MAHTRLGIEEATKRQPKFLVTAIARVGGDVVLKGHIFGNPGGGAADLYLGSTRFVECSITAPPLMRFWFWKRKEWTVDLKEDCGDLIQVGQTYAVFDGYMGDRVRLVIEEQRAWVRLCFMARPHWKHDHCNICWATISEEENREHVEDREENQLCLGCYDGYVLTKSLDFLNEDRGAQGATT